MINGVMWNFSVWCDKQMEEDPYWNLSEEGQACLYWIRRENERLDAIIRQQRERTASPSSRPEEK